MFCPNCGNQLSDTAHFCSKCGTAISSNAQPHPMQPNNTQPNIAQPNVAQPNNSQPYYTQSRYAQPGYAASATTIAGAKKNYAPLIIGIVGILALLVLAVFLFRGCASGVHSGSVHSSPEKVVDHALSSLIELDLKETFSCMPDEYLAFLAQEDGYVSADAMLNDLSMELQQALEEADQQLSSYGLSNISAQDFLKTFLSYEVGKSTQVDKSTLEYYQEEWNYEIPGFGDKFQDAAWVTTTIKLGGEIELFGQKVPLSNLLGEDTNHTADILCVKIADRWYMLDAEDLSLNSLGSLF